MATVAQSLLDNVVPAQKTLYEASPVVADNLHQENFSLRKPSTLTMY